MSSCSRCRKYSFNLLIISISSCIFCPFCTFQLFLATLIIPNIIFDRYGRCISTEVFYFLLESRQTRGSFYKFPLTKTLRNVLLSQHLFSKNTIFFFRLIRAIQVCSKLDRYRFVECFLWNRGLWVIGVGFVLRVSQLLLDFQAKDLSCTNNAANFIY